MPTRARSGRTATPHALHNGARQVARLYARYLDAAGVGWTEFALLKAIKATGAARQVGLARLYGLGSSTVARSLRALERRGWVRSRAGFSDRRKRYWTLSPAGRRAVAKATPAWYAAQRRLRETLGRAGWATLQSRLEAIAQRVAQ